MIITIEDDDHPFSDDTVDIIVIQRTMSPGDSEQGDFSGQYIGDLRMRITVGVHCDPNFYGSRCSSMCVPRDDSTGHYTCGTNGQIVCNPGWIDPFYSCTTRKFPLHVASKQVLCGLCPFANVIVSLPDVCSCL